MGKRRETEAPFDEPWRAVDPPPVDSERVKREGIKGILDGRVKKVMDEYVPPSPPKADENLSPPSTPQPVQKEEQVSQPAPPPPPSPSPPAEQLAPGERWRRNRERLIEERKEGR